MTQETVGTIARVSRQWWCKMNTKAARMGTFDGAIFPHVVRVEYLVNGKTYVLRKWLHAGARVPTVGSTVTVRYDTEKPGKANFPS